MARERIEVRPGVWLWLSGKDLEAFHARQAEPVAEEPKLITSAAITAPEQAVLSTPKARRPASKR